MYFGKGCGKWHRMRWPREIDGGDMRGTCGKVFTLLRRRFFKDMKSLKRLLPPEVVCKTCIRFGGRWHDHYEQGRDYQEIDCLSQVPSQKAA